MSDAGSDETSPGNSAIDIAPNAVFDGLLAALEGAVCGQHRDRFNAWIRVDASDWVRAASLCRTQLGCSYFSFLSGMDWQPNPALDGEKTFTEGYVAEVGPIIVDPSIRLAGGSSRFQVVGHIYNPESHEGLTLTADLDDEHPAVNSWTSVYRGADWHEREAWEMFGFDFIGHPGLRNIYLPSEFVGNPLRKDYPLVSRIVRPWPGLVDMEDIPIDQGDQANEVAKRSRTVKND